ncbi:hypothetical protein I8J29_12875 [Paenibacillus sp. MWE-103]|uniref:Holin n=1 Tax=Paenibacillus artemisiicola TaxID=1172618 RepID=A0ABS3W9T2_9BACL|nr:hypothetical protein [Paenibacillus artemisiicola]MBO7745096.1 hypothetical protein [Paenibacillus artemisiicola]
MNTNVKWLTLIPAVLGALKLIAQPYGISIPDKDINDLVNGIAAVVSIVGIIMNHKAPKQPQALPNQAEPAK